MPTNTVASGRTYKTVALPGSTRTTRILVASAAGRKVSGDDETLLTSLAYTRTNHTLPPKSPNNVIFST